MKLVTNWGMNIRSPLQPLDLSVVDAIALHHMAHPTADLYEVERWHLNQGWRAIGYNYWVALDGQIYECRGLHMGAGVEQQNHHIISIGFQGDYHTAPTPMPDKQFNSGLAVIGFVQSQVPTIKTIGGHQDFMATACPGQYFPLTELQKGIPRNYELTLVNDLVWELAHRGIIEEKNKWHEKLSLDEDAYWLARKAVNYIRTL